MKKEITTTEFYCDICGRKISDSNLWKSIGTDRHKRHGLVIYIHIPQEKAKIADICPHCIGEIKKTIERLINESEDENND